MESRRFCTLMSRVGNNQPITLMPGDIFNFSIKVFSYSINRDSLELPQLLYYSPSQSVPCHNFFQEGQGFFSTLLSRIHFLLEFREEIIDKVMFNVRELFQVDDAASASPSSESQHRELPVKLIIIVFDNDLNARMDTAIEESMQYFRMIPASDQAIQTLKKSIVIPPSERCIICLEDLDINAECNIMPCNHVFHPQCIVTWLQTSHVCPLCRYPLPTF